MTIINIHYYVRLIDFLALTFGEEQLTSYLAFPTWHFLEGLHFICRFGCLHETQNTEKWISTLTPDK